MRPFDAITLGGREDSVFVWVVVVFFFLFVSSTSRGGSEEEKLFFIYPFSRRQVTSGLTAALTSLAAVEL